jgi:hypothetical protein
MGELTGESVRRLMRELYGYEISDADADTLARRARALVSGARNLESLELDGIEQPFSFAVLVAEAERIRSK